MEMSWRNTRDASGRGRPLRISTFPSGLIANRRSGSDFDRISFFKEDVSAKC